MQNVIPFRLRIGRDDDLKNALESIPSYIERSDIIREALRMYFFNAPTPILNSINKHEKVEIRPPVISVKKLEITETNDDMDSKLNKSLGF